MIEANVVTEEENFDELFNLKNQNSNLDLTLQNQPVVALKHCALDMNSKGIENGSECESEAYDDSPPNLEYSPIINDTNDAVDDNVVNNDNNDGANNSADLDSLNSKGIDNIKLRSSHISEVILKTPKIRSIFMLSLVEVSTNMMEEIWPELSLNHLKFAYFIKELLKRSRASVHTLQLSLYYISLLKENKDEDFIKKNYIDCKKLFVSSIILATKNLQDIRIPLHAWCKVSGLSKNELIKNEILLFKALNWNCYVQPYEYDEWNSLITKKTIDNLADLIKEKRKRDLDIDPDDFKDEISRPLERKVRAV